MSEACWGYLFRFLLGFLPSPAGFWSTVRVAACPAGKCEQVEALCCDSRWKLVLLLNSRGFAIVEAERAARSWLYRPKLYESRSLRFFWDVSTKVGLRWFEKLRPYSEDLGTDR